MEMRRDWALDISQHIFPLALAACLVRGKLKSNSKSSRYSCVMSPQIIGQLRVGLAQVNPTVGNLESNSELVLEYAGKAASAGAHILLLPEMVLTGYPIED